MDNFQAIQHEYGAEGVNIFDFSLVDNTDVMELLEGKLGLITQLNEECMKKGVGGDENFVYKVSIRSFPPFFQSRNKNENELRLIILNNKNTVQGCQLQFVPHDPGPPS